MTMDHYHILSILLFLVIIFSLTSGRTIFNDDDNSYSNEDEQQNSLLDLSSHFSNNNNNKREFHQRSISTLSSTSQSRQQIIDLLRKAYHEGWKPNIKHYMPSSRFGRNG